jgi:hypothetical protein
MNPMIPKTEVTIRVRGKNNNLEVQKGYLEMTVEQVKVLIVFLFLER